MSAAKRGPQPYTDEPTKKAGVALDEALRQMKIDAATHAILLQSLTIELSREYLEDPELRARVLRRVYERLGREWPG